MGYPRELFGEISAMRTKWRRAACRRSRSLSATTS